MAESSDLSEWPRSIADAAVLTARKISSTATGGIGRHVGQFSEQFNKCGRGGIGRHVGFRFQWATVQVQVLSPVPKKKGDQTVSFFLWFKERRDLNNLNATVRWTVAGEGWTEPNNYFASCKMQTGLVARTKRQSPYGDCRFFVTHRQLSA